LWWRFGLACFVSIFDLDMSEKEEEKPVKRSDICSKVLIHTDKAW
jgi:hypothetical protein